MNRINQGLWLSAAIATALFAAGCGESGNDGGTGCTTDAQCATTQTCHPLLKTCVTSCTSGTDCPSSAKTCATMTGLPGGNDAGVKAFCQCSTDQLCNGGGSGNLVCQDGASKTCENKCTATGGCPSGYTCNTTTGKCGSGGTDGGADGGTPCTDLGQCTYPQVCSFTTNPSYCVAGAACNTTNAQPDTCGYAGYCTGAANCAQVDKPTCANFTPPGGKTPVFNPRTSTGPIIYYVIDEAVDDAAFCTVGSRAFTLTIQAYTPGADWPAQHTAVQGFKYVRTDGTEIDATTIMRPSGYTRSAKAATFKLTLCSTTATANLSAGFYFTNGNEYCATAAGSLPGTG